MRCIIAAFLVSASLLAQSPPPPCPAGRPIDEIIAEIKDYQAKKKHRNKNPLPQGICILGWCRELGPTPPPEPQPTPRREPSGAASGTTSSSKTSVDDCNAALDRALEAAHDVEVGDYYFEKQNYKAASLRYQDAVEQKPGDAAIHVRLGRVFEKLKDVAHALEHYEAAEKLDPPEPWSLEAHTAVARLHRQP